MRPFLQRLVSVSVLASMFWPVASPAAPKAPDQPPDQILRTVKNNSGSLQLDVQFLGPQDQTSPYPTVTLIAPKRTGKPGNIQIGYDAAAAVVEQLAADGFHTRAVPAKQGLPPGEERRYLLIVSVTHPAMKSSNVYYERLGWDLQTLRRAESLAKVLDGKARVAMDGLVKRLEAHRAEWEKNAPASAPATRPAGS